MRPLNQGIYRFPSIHQSSIVFTSDDDLWKVELDNPIAIRLTANLGRCLSPSISPDGSKVAFIGEESGTPDVYLISINGGEAKRLTFKGQMGLIGWKNQTTLLVRSSHETPFARINQLYTLSIKTGELKLIEVGPANTISYGDQQKSLIGRNTADPARWKRYRGGTAGTIWVKNKGSYQQILKNLKSNLADPHFVGSSIYFLSDHSGQSNVYCVATDGQRPKQLTFSKEFYVRHLNTDGNRLVYMMGGDLYTLDINKPSKGPQKVEIEFYTPGIQRQRRFESFDHYLDDFSLSSDGNEVALIGRGRLYKVRPWKDSPFILGEIDTETRYKLPVWVNDNKSLLVCAVDSDHEEKLILFDQKDLKAKQLYSQKKWGKIWSMVAAPSGDQVALINNRNELYLLNLKKNTVQLIESNKFDRPKDISWSPHGRYLAYCCSVDQRRKGLKVYDLKKKKGQFLINSILNDSQPVFDPEGKYLYFLSIREFAPNYSQTHFDLSFPFAGRPYALSLRSEFPNPFETHLDTTLNPEDEEEGGHPFYKSYGTAEFKGPTQRKKGKSAKTKATQSKKKKPARKNEKTVDTEIEFEGIEGRIVAFPVEMGGYASIAAVNNKLLFLKTNIAPIEIHQKCHDHEDYHLYSFCFEEHKTEVLMPHIDAFTLSDNLKRILVLSKGRLRLTSTDAPPKLDGGFNKKDGWIDLSQVKLQIDPQKEWKQMYREAWILQREHFWQKKISTVDWQQVYERYFPLLERVHTRSEFSDLLWEMQGELGTSHCYEYEGDYHRIPPMQPVGRLGAQFKYLDKSKSFEITNIYHGDSWYPNGDSPFNKMGIALKEGDRILGVDGRHFTNEHDFPHNQLDRHLESKIGQNINLHVQRKGRAKSYKKEEIVSVPTMTHEKAVLYRQWVESNKKLVHEKSKNQIGYVHIPDMMATGFSEFYRHYLAELNYNGLIIDVRFNSGGHISQHLLKILAQKIVGFDMTRWNGVEPYPLYAVNGPLVGLTNEHAGSDGDIFSHTFKLLKLGKLIGKRTWGGVIGINGQYMLKDGTVVTQPEYSFWFKDVGHKVENYGTKPDIEIDITPEDYKRGKDTQLHMAIDTAMNSLKSYPTLESPKY